ncbi:hypothetical protein SARC_10840 [Sphaeroforma arctica JP610]|uniref:Hydroxymethylglutaryl-coenzyme A synthase C-terminal domain-containing protein n=1 Tax=Sphaeroforma arctica JP610 TaxID=667725 RepID=A0A0L0FIR9_9EUKA|nr:hypothetical protein SARC_10840 [Sphaeroforma arctica JP610]KNC76669.1 hypothetical protein SARC_10840 [Sphaeroforma arctica JP610]|eukprot:XP_014150571.1 hypothetical protein SARC_10840 [Sphaeroforma arctica JP610]
MADIHTQIRSGVCGDIAVYAEGNARPTGGAGAVAMLIGRDAPLVVEPTRASYFEHQYDFYKPELNSEYPTVDSRLSMTCYLRAVDRCYQSLVQKYERRQNQVFDIATPDYYVFHSPFTKLVRKAFARIHYNDYLLRGDASAAFIEGQPISEDIGTRDPETTYLDRECEKVFLDRSKGLFADKVVPSLLLAKETGNSYTASLYFGLISLLHTTGAKCIPGGTPSVDARVLQMIIFFVTSLF